MSVWPCSLVQLLDLEAAKQSLESVNDSLRLQLDEVREAGLEAEELRIRGELEETQAALTTAEDDIKTYQQDLSDTRVHSLLHDVLHNIECGGMYVTV